MKKGNVVDLVPYQEQTDVSETRLYPSISEELEKAIQNLIYRLKTLGPLQS